MGANLQLRCEGDAWVLKSAGTNEAVEIDAKTKVASRVMRQNGPSEMCIFRSTTRLSVEGCSFDMENSSPDGRNALRTISKSMMRLIDWEAFLFTVARLPIPSAAPATQEPDVRDVVVARR